MNEETLTKEEKQERVFNLNVELADVLLKKKSTMAAFNEELKRIKAEIKDYIAPEQQGFEIV